MDVNRYGEESLYQKEKGNEVACLAVSLQRFQHYADLIREGRRDLKPESLRTSL